MREIVIEIIRKTHYDGMLVVSAGQLASLIVEAMTTGGDGILQPWVAKLGLRHQGVLVSAVRGCDTAPKDDASKAVARVYRGAVLRAHCGDAAKARTFIESVTDTELLDRLTAFAKNFDHYPLHYVTHLMHAVEVLGYANACPQQGIWQQFYRKLCRKLHVTPETTQQLDERLNADEETFGQQQ